MGERLKIKLHFGNVDCALLIFKTSKKYSIWARINFEYSYITRSAIIKIIIIGAETRIRAGLKLF